MHLENVRGHAQTLLRLDLIRKMQEKARDVYRAMADADEDLSFSQIVQLAETPIQDLALSYLREDQTTPIKLGDGIDLYLESLIENPVESVGLSTGLPSFDKALGGGLRRKCVDVVGARSGVGKSMIADHAALHNVQKGIPVLMLDTEMDDTSHQNRLLANLSSVEINRIATGQFSRDNDQKEGVLAAAQKIKSVPYHYLNVSGRPFDEVLSIIRRWLVKEVGYDEYGNMRDCVIIYDYLKLMTSDSITNNIAEYQALGFQITQLHNFCVEYDVPCLTFVQLNRDGITKESTDAVSGSDRILWLCTSFSIFKDKTVDEIAEDTTHGGNSKLIPLKTRHGPGLDDLNEKYICILKEGGFARLTDKGTLADVNQAKLEKANGLGTVTDSESEESIKL